ncbi:unnamed protein product [Owenia fusiformis]|uniref:Uncharacterized protein n=1 Tax=Owenia fusiformis TaxID=6347 RepID=A0A8J1T8L8_OWEFU|nr:unnamed protein product [Owenia fusiformis]
MMTMMMMMMMGIDMLKVLVCSVFCSICFLDAAVINNRDAMTYLEKNGYMVPGKSQRDSILHFQCFTHLPQTGVIDEGTMEMMNQQRCGVPDIQVTANFRTTRLKWNHKRISYNFVNYSPDLPRNIVELVLTKSFKIWSDVTSLRFNQINSLDADLNIRFAAGVHGNKLTDPPFDGPGNILAHAFYPRDGRIHFDEDENWTIESRSGRNLLNVAVHEIGHALGLGHSYIKEAIMYPYIPPYNPDFHLHTDDIAGIRSLYGNNEDWTNPINEKCITPSNVKMVSGITSLQLCKDACKAEQSFVCLALDYNERLETCQLSRTYHLNSIYRECPGYVSTERRTGGPWTDKYNTCIQGNDDAIVENAQCYQSCKVKCYAENSFVCLSFEFERAKNECRLSKKNSSNATLQRPCPNRGVHYFERQQG